MYSQKDQKVQTVNQGTWDLKENQALDIALYCQPIENLVRESSNQKRDIKIMKNIIKTRTRSSIKSKQQKRFSHSINYYESIIKRAQKDQLTKLQLVEKSLSANRILVNNLKGKSIKQKKSQYDRRYNELERELQQEQQKNSEPLFDVLKLFG